ncbi:MAG: MFS transporter [Actinomycetota bacterium]|nr:MFS transporter [Actinomycetota bacterium]
MTDDHALSRWKALTAMVTAGGIVQLPTGAIVVALPAIHNEFNASIADLQWTVTAFFIPQAALLIACGRLADIFGRRRAFGAGAILFAAGSGMATAAEGTGLLIAGMAVAGVGAALLLPASLAIITNVFTGKRRGLAIGMWGAATELISGVGVLVGGVLTGEFDWRWIFVVCLAVTAVMALLTVLGVPESNDPTVSRTVDIAGVVLSAGGLTALTLGLIQGPTWGWSSATVVALLVGGVVAFAALGVAEVRSRHPLFDFSFFRRRNFTGSTIVLFVIDFSFGALLFFLPTYFQEILGYSPTEAGVLLLPLTGLMVIGSPLGGRVAAQIGPRVPIVAGLGLMTVAIWWISALSLETGYAELWAPTAIMGFGLGFALTPMNLAALNAVSRDHAGAASGILVTLSGLGSTLGVAVTGALFQELQTNRTVALAGQAGVQITKGQAAQLDGVLSGAAGATTTLNQIAGAQAPAVKSAVRDAFVSAVGTSFKVSAVLVAAGVVLALILMRKEPAVDGPVAHPVLPPPTRPAPRTGVAQGG